MKQLFIFSGILLSLASGLQAEPSHGAYSDARGLRGDSAVSHLLGEGRNQTATAANACGLGQGAPSRPTASISPAPSSTPASASYADHAKAE